MSDLHSLPDTFMALPGLDPTTADLIWMAVPMIFAAGLIHGTFGIGFPMVATPLLALFTDVLTAVQLTLLPTMAVNLSMIARGGREQARAIRPHLGIIPFTLAGTILGSLLLLWLDPRPFLLLLAIALLLYLNQDRLRRLNFSWVNDHPHRARALFGITAGLMAGTVNVMLPILIVLFMELRIATATMVVLFNLNFFTGKITQSLLFLQQGIPGFGALLAATLWLVPVALLALQAGRQLSHRISETGYRRVLRGVLWLMAGVLCLRFVHAYWIA